MKKNILVLIVLLYLEGLSIFGQEPIQPKDVLSDEEIFDVIRNKNFFLYKDIGYKLPVWMNTNRKYSSHFLGERDHYLDLKEVLRLSIHNGFSIQYSLMQLYRSKLLIHKRVGDILPNIQINIGTSSSLFGIDNLFGGIFSFLHPANWMKLKNQKIVYKVSKLMLSKVILDQLMDAHLLYIDLHQIITEFEILNYYFIHLQILADTYQIKDRELTTIIGRFAYAGTEMASKRGDAKLGFNKLADYIALEKVDDKLAVNNLNISDIIDFPSKVKDISKLDMIYRDKELFINKVLTKSIELKIVEELYHISKLNIGITALGGVFSYIDRPINPSMDLNYAFKLGYGTLPEILIAKSFSRTAKIDVRQEYFNILDIARKSFDLYTNSLGGYIEAKRALTVNRRALAKNIKYFNKMGKAPDAIFILALNNLVGAELKINNALHGSLKARCHMDRLLLKSEVNLYKLLPNENQILRIYQKFVKKNLLASEHEKIIDELLKNTHKASKLNRILFEHMTYEKLAGVTLDEVIEGVKRNINHLLSSNWKCIKNRYFYRVLAKFIETHSIGLTGTEQMILKKKCKY